MGVTALYFRVICRSQAVCLQKRLKQMPTEPDRKKRLPSKEKFSFLFLELLLNVSCLVVGGGGGGGGWDGEELTLVWYVELTSQRADEEVNFFHR